MINNTREKVLKIYCTFFYAGYVPFGPGTFGTLGAVIPFYFIAGLTPPFYLITILFFTAISIKITNHCIKYYNEEDPGEIVIDEVCGYLFTMFMLPFNWFNVLSGILIFRILDIIKPYPVRKAENLRDGYGIILDDVLAGIYSNIIIHLINRIL